MYDSSISGSYNFEEGMCVRSPSLQLYGQSRKKKDLDRGTYKIDESLFLHYIVGH